VPLDVPLDGRLRLPLSRLTIQRLRRRGLLYRQLPAGGHPRNRRVELARGLAVGVLELALHLRERAPKQLAELHRRHHLSFEVSLSRHGPEPTGTRCNT